MTDFTMPMLNQSFDNSHNMNPTAGMQVYVPSGKGTKLSDIAKKNDMMQYEQNYKNPEYHYTQYDSTPDRQSIYEGIEKIADDVNQSLLTLEESDKNAKKQRKRKRNKMANDDINCDQDNSDNHTDDVNNDTVSDKLILETFEQNNDYMKLFIEFLILLTLYVIMSQEFVIKFMANYIHQLNPSNDGTANLTGILIYGTILTILFIIFRKIIFYKLQ